MNGRTSLEEMKKMREAAIKRAKATQARSQGGINFSSLNNHSNKSNKIEEKVSNNINSSKDKGININKENENLGSDSKATNISIVSGGNKSNKFPFENLSCLLKDILHDTDKALIFILIFLLIDNEENFPVLLVLFYLLF